MTQMIFINLPVTNLPASMRFYEAVGFTNEPRFSDETAACMVLTDVIHVMLLTHDKWRQFTSKPIVDAHSAAQVALCLSRESRDAVDAIMDLAAAAGGTIDPNPPQDYGVMFGRSFEDPDGHNWEVMWMDAAAAEVGAAAIDAAH
jgi:predicted lactoylglutathione lyase